MTSLAKGKENRKGPAMVGAIVGILFMSRDFTHRAHLKTGSYAQHEALGGFYDDIVGQADSLAEAAQGLYGKINIDVVDMTGNIDKPAVELEKQLMQIKKLSANCDEQFLIDIITAIETCYRSTLYKLNELS